jgi:diadenosine tetraphosphate (Ap4A) HIT family hydrolase
MRRCGAAARALRRALGAEKVYLNAMCDGEINHLHFQLFPRYPGDPIGSRRFVLPRQPAEDAPATAAAVRAAFGALWRGA